MKHTLLHLRIGRACNWLRPNVFPFVFGICSFLFLPVSTLAQEPFTEITINMLNVGDGSVAWGDYDGDDDLDILLTGNDIPPYFVKHSIIYRNDDGNFVDINAPLIGVATTPIAISWADYDGDGDLDIILAGWTGLNSITRLYQNNSGNFSAVTTNIPNVTSGSVDWGDYDNDGDLDLLITGRESDIPPYGNYIATVFRNDAGSFVNKSVPLIQVIGSARWGDYDNDGDLDIAISGSDGTNFYGNIYRNDAGTFHDIAAGIQGGEAPDVAWGDYDIDGDLDLLVSGYNRSRAFMKLYQNNNGNFTEVSTSMHGASNTTVSWGDYDNDGDLDVLYGGNTYLGYFIGKVYRNDGMNSFTEIAAGLPNVIYTGSSWGDYDNDGDLDILINGNQHVSSGYVTKIFRNNTVTSNNPPNVPNGLTNTINGNSVTLSWNKATDNQTPQNGLTYNLRVGTSPGLANIVSPMATMATGYRQIPKLGNTNHNNSWTLKNLPNGIYYWSVQAIDNALAGGPFAQEGSFTIGPPLKVVVPIDIKPGTIPNTINPKSKGVIPVAILTTPTFSAVSVDPLSVKFGPNGATESHGRGHIEDADGDGDMDMVLHFKTEETGIQCGDVEASLTGETFGGQAIIGTDAIQTVGCSAAKASVEQETNLLEEFVLVQNYPNPFNPETEIRFQLPEASHVFVRILNTLGEEIRTIVDAPYEAGYHRVRWDGKDKNGNSIASGVYLYQLQVVDRANGGTGTFSQVRKMTLLR